MTDIVERLQAWAECGPNALLEAASADLFEAADEIDRLRAQNDRLAAENEHWRKQDDAIRAEFGGKRDGRATIDCLREAFAATWSEEDALFQATLDMKREELRAENERLAAENERLRVALVPRASLFLYPDDLRLNTQTFVMTLTGTKT